MLGDNLILSRKKRIKTIRLRISLIKSPNLLQMCCWMMGLIIFMGSFFRSICIHMPKLLREKIIIRGLIQIWFSKTIWWVERLGAQSIIRINWPRINRLSLVSMRLKTPKTLKEWLMVEHKPMTPRDNLGLFNKRWESLAKKAITKEQSTTQFTQPPSPKAP